MALFKLSPEFAAKWNKLRRNRRAYISLIIFSLMFLFSLPSELLFNDRPLAMKLDGKWYFPAFRATPYTWQDFGVNNNAVVNDFRGIAWRDFISNRQEDARSMAMDLFGSVGDEVPVVAERPASTEPHEVSYIWPLIVHSYKSSVELPRAERNRTTLIAPWNFKTRTSTGYYSYTEGEYQIERRPLFIEEAGGYQDGHWLGTDSNGKDMLARLVYGFRISIFFGLGLAIVGAVLGTLIGAVQGFFGGWVDMLGQRLIEIWGSIPQLYVLMILSSFLAAKAELSPMRQGILLFGILSSTSWMGMSSYMRAEFLRARNLEYVKAAKALGQSDFKIMMRHILPNSLTPLITFLPFNISAGMLALTSLDFLGLGLKYPTPSLGELLAQGEQNMEAYWILIPTFILISVSLLLLNFIGEGMREAFDPRVK